MSDIGQRFGKFIQEVARGIVFSDESKERVIRSLNRKVNIPFLSESQERELFELMWDAIVEGFRDDKD